MLRLTDFRLTDFRSPGWSCRWVMGLGQHGDKGGDPEAYVEGNGRICERISSADGVGAGLRGTAVPGGDPRRCA